jgi:hypothetical protein
MIVLQKDSLKMHDTVVAHFIIYNTMRYDMMTLSVYYGKMEKISVILTFSDIESNHRHNLHI